MVALSKQHEKCNACKYKDKCNTKRMVACGIMEMKPSKAEIQAPIIEPKLADVAVKHTPVSINMGEYGTINTSFEEIHEQLRKKLSININCGFNETL